MSEFSCGCTVYIFHIPHCYISEQEHRRLAFQLSVTLFPLPVLSPQSLFFEVVATPFVRGLSHVV